MRAGFMILGASGLIGCVQSVPAELPPQFPVRVVTTQSRVAPGGSLAWTLINGSDSVLGYNGCLQSLQVWRGGRWRQVFELPSEPARADGIQIDCTAMRYVLDAGDSVSLRTDIPRETAAGTYRIVFHWIHAVPEGQSSRLVSPLFEIR